MKIKTQRALGQYDGNDALVDAINPDVLLVPDSHTNVPVLVVPEAEVRGCHSKHVRAMSPVDRWCENCGAFKGAFTTKWQRPRILRAGRSK